MSHIKYGCVTKIINYKPLEFEILDDNNNFFKCTYNGYCALQEHDIIGFECVKNGKKLTITKPPRIKIIDSREATIDSILKCFKGKRVGTRKANDLYEKIERYVEGDESSINAYLDEMSEKYFFSQEEVIKDFTEIFNWKETDIRKLMVWWYQKRPLRRLYTLGIFDTEIKAYPYGPRKMYEECSKNPYSIFQIDITKARSISNLFGLEKDEKIEKAGVIGRKIYDNLIKNQNLSTPKEKLIKIFPDIDNYESILFEKFEIKFFNECYYMKYQFEVETEVSTFIKKQLSLCITPDDNYSKVFDKKISDEQRDAINGALTKRISIITGGAGTGKTSCLKELVQNLEFFKIKWIACSFTGKSVSRLRNVLGTKDCKTIDKIISAGVNESVAIGYMVFIIDEISMVTTELFYRLIKLYSKVVSEFNIIFVGDLNQLPPLSWGSLMLEMVKSEKIPIFKLTKSFRVDDSGNESNIITNSNNLISPERDFTKSFKFKTGNDFFIISKEGKKAVENLLQGFKDLGILGTEICILSPYNADLELFNNYYHQIYLDEDDIYEHNNVVWYRGDTVMMNNNDYTINIMNGEEGIIKKFTDKGIVVSFGDEEFIYHWEVKDTDSDEWVKTERNVKWLTPSTAKTIHKSQGSEYNYVIIYFSEEKKDTGFLNINMLYTAMTRAKKNCFIITSKEVLEVASRTKIQPRYENLGYMIKN